MSLCIGFCRLRCWLIGVNPNFTIFPSCVLIPRRISPLWFHVSLCIGFCRHHNWLHCWIFGVNRFSPSIAMFPSCVLIPRRISPLWFHVSLCIGFCRHHHWLHCWVIAVLFNPSIIISPIPCILLPRHANWSWFLWVLGVCPVLCVEFSKSSVFALGFFTYWVGFPWLFFFAAFSVPPLISVHVLRADMSCFGWFWNQISVVLFCLVLKSNLNVGLCLVLFWNQT